MLSSVFLQFIVFMQSVGVDNILQLIYYTVLQVDTVARLHRSTGCRDFTEVGTSGESGADEGVWEDKLTVGLERVITAVRHLPDGGAPMRYDAN